jgi:hypothetical protein
MGRAWGGRRIVTMQWPTVSRICDGNSPERQLDAGRNDDYYGNITALYSILQSQYMVFHSQQSR